MDTPLEGAHHRLQAFGGGRQPQPGHLRHGEPLPGRRAAAGTPRRAVLLQGDILIIYKYFQRIVKSPSFLLHLQLNFGAITAS